MITSKTQLNAVIGLPIGHSRSPVLHNALYQKLGIDAAMLAFSHKEVRPLIEAIKSLNIGLTAVTMPFKQKVMPFLHKIDKNARAMKSVNTIINKNGKLHGYNTDVEGIAMALKKVRLRKKNILIIGAGGAARAAAFYCKQSGARLFYHNRTKSKAVNLSRQFGGVVIGTNKIEQIKVSLIINATPMGMHPKIKSSPYPKEMIKKGQCVFDLVYNPRQTQLLKDARSVGAKGISGIGMFVSQAIRQIELYSGKKLNNPKIYRLAEQLLSSK